MVRDGGIHVDPDEDPDVRDVIQEWADGKVAGGAEIPDEGVEPLDIRVAFENPFELGQKGLLPVIREELR
jgi:hypothetical protein